MAKRSRKKRRPNPAANLTDDLIVEILSRLPVKSVCRFKCVSRHWRRLISDPDHRRKLPQTLAGVFCRAMDAVRFPKEARHFVNLWENRLPPLVCPSLSFFPGYQRVSRILDSCNGLLLCRLTSESSSPSQDAPFRYVVCNPATKSWVVLPDSGCGSKLRTARVGFDPAVSLHFHVFEFVEDEDDNVVAVQIFSCETRAWSYKESEWGYETTLYSDDARSVFLNGLLHLVIVEFGVVAVDVKGETWWRLTVPDCMAYIYYREDGFLGRFQGQLCYINGCDYENDLSIWVLEDYTADEWILKHHVSIQHLCDKIISPSESRFYHVVAVHPDCNMILYFAGQEKTLMAYDIGHEETRAIKNLGRDCWLPVIPYVPFYLESLADGHSTL